MARIYVGIGSNIEPERNIRSCIGCLRECFQAVVVSTVYQTAAVGFAGADFLNLAAGFETEADVYRVAAQLREIEDRHGRRRAALRFCARTLDLDLLIYDDWVLEENGLCIPRPDITRHAFVLGPLAEIAGQWRHPRLGMTLQEIWAQFDTRGERLRPVALEW